MDVPIDSLPSRVVKSPSWLSRGERGSGYPCRLLVCERRDTTTTLVNAPPCRGSLFMKAHFAQGALAQKGEGQKTRRASHMPGPVGLLISSSRANHDARGPGCVQRVLDVDIQIAKGDDEEGPSSGTGRSKSSRRSNSIGRARRSTHLRLLRHNFTKRLEVFQELGSLLRRRYVNESHRITASGLAGPAQVLGVLAEQCWPL